MGSHPLKLFWIAWYDKPFPTPDAETLPQFHPLTGKEAQFKDIDQSRIKSMVLYAFTPEMAELVNKTRGALIAIPMILPRYVVHLGNGKRLIHLRRNHITFRNIATPEIIGKGIIYLLGWQTTEPIAGSPQGRNRKAVMFITEDGSVELMDQAGTQDEREGSINDESES